MDNLMALALNNYANLCTKYKWLANSPKQQHIVAISTELDNIKDNNIKLANFFKAKGIKNVNTHKKVNQKWNKEKKPKHKNDENYAWNKVPPRQGKKETKTMKYKTCN